MNWRKLSDLLYLQRRAIAVPAVAEFAKGGKKADDTFKRFERATRELLDEIFREFAKSGKWPTLSDEQSLIFCFRLNQDVNLALALSRCIPVLFPTEENQKAATIQWALNDRWKYPGLPNTACILSDKQHFNGGEKWN